MRTTQMFGGFTSGTVVAAAAVAFVAGFGCGAAVAAADGRSTDNGDKRRAARLAKAEAEKAAKAEPAKDAAAKAAEAVKKAA